ncbi:MAG TPA: hypothetical protein VKS79_23370 [Gemmataceae bacterium]|nr:hypothetical protein [Gemmataceae bacterium]
MARVTIWLGILAVLLIAAGCSPKPKGVQELQPVVKHLQAISGAYIKTTQTLGRPPKNAAELRPALQEAGDPDQLLRSPGDGEEFVIVWGVDPRGPQAAPKDGKLAVLIYEKKGTGGKHYVLQMPTMITTLTDDELKNAYFPGGHKYSP